MTAPHPAQDQLLVHLISGGNTEAMRRFYELHFPRALGVAQRILRSRALAEEVCQEAFLQLWTQADRVDDAPGAGLHFLMLLIHRRSIDVVRREERHRSVRASAPHLPDIADQVVIADAWNRVVREANNLEEPYRSVVVLAYLENRTCRQVAEILQVPEGTVKSWRRAALKQLRARLAHPRARKLGGLQTPARPSSAA
ncbi:MAG: RNA polymerase sigma factor [Acidimicrobiia bacterium]